MKIPIVKNDDTWFIYIRTPKIEAGRYVKSTKGEPLGCVCVTKNEDGTYNRGISICSEKDKFNKKIGRNIAQYRAMANTSLNINRANIKYGTWTPVRVYLEYVYTTMNVQFGASKTDQFIDYHPVNFDFPIAFSHLKFEELTKLERQTIKE